MAKNIDYSCRGPGFRFQHLHGDSKPPVAPVQVTPMLTSLGNYMNIVHQSETCINTRTNNKQINIVN